MPTLRELPDEINPVARVKNIGAAHLSSAELLAILIERTGGEKSPLEVALQTMQEWGTLHSLGAMCLEQLTFQYGFTEHVATRLLVAAELGKRVRTDPHPVLQQKRVVSPLDLFERHFQDMGYLQQEELRVLSLDIKNRVLSCKLLYLGSVHTNLVRIGEILREPILRMATGLVIAHNHPSGDPTPSPEDCALTREIFKAGLLLDIDLIDHLVIGGRKYVSMKEQGLGF